MTSDFKTAGAAWSYRASAPYQYSDGSFRLQSIYELLELAHEVSPEATRIVACRLMRQVAAAVEGPRVGDAITAALDAVEAGRNPKPLGERLWWFQHANSVLAANTALNNFVWLVMRGSPPSGILRAAEDAIAAVQLEALPNFERTNITAWQDRLRREWMWEVRRGVIEHLCEVFEVAEPPTFDCHPSDPEYRVPIVGRGRLAPWQRDPEQIPGATRPLSGSQKAAIKGHILPAVSASIAAFDGAVYSTYQLHRLVGDLTSATCQADLTAALWTIERLFAQAEEKLTWAADGHPDRPARKAASDAARRLYAAVSAAVELTKGGQ